tara:strand:- start:5520 stop:6044 length:525 start_codon:yes stop_codon:yes gene_type:complete
MNKVFILFFTFLTCNQIESRLPINNKSISFIEKSANNNKLRAAREQKLLNISALNDSNNIYKASPLGFLYSIKQTHKNKKSAKKGDLAEIKYKIEDLDNQLLYNEEELGTLSFLVDQEDVIPALREGVKYLSEGNSGIFLFPSHLCFGYQGDREKIGSNQPLRITINLLTLKKN